LATLSPPLLALDSCLWRWTGGHSRCVGRVLRKASVTVDGPGCCLGWRKGFKVRQLFFFVRSVMHRAHATKLALHVANMFVPFVDGFLCLPAHLSRPSTNTFARPPAEFRTTPSAHQHPPPLTTRQPLMVSTPEDSEIVLQT